MKDTIRRSSHYRTVLGRFSWLAVFAAAAVMSAVEVAAILMMHPAGVAAQAVTQAYSADSGTQNGMFVRLDTNDKNKVDLVDQANAGKTFGVVVQPNDAPISLSDSSGAQRVYVATTGAYQVLVSDQNGPIKKGDFLVISAVGGIAMKADQSQQFAIAKALDNFDGTGSNVRSQTALKDSKGETHVVHFGSIGADINVARNPLVKAPQDSLPSFLRRAAQAVSDKPVSPLRVYIGAVIAVVTAGIVIATLYAGVRTSITSLGRNPLARSTIMRNLLQVTITSFIILIIGLFAVYLLLKL